MADPPEDALIGLNRAVTTARLQAGAVHDVNNALQVILGTLELLEGAAGVPPAVTQALQRIGQQSRRAAATLAELLIFTRAPAGGRGPVNLKEIATHSLALRQYAMKRAGLSARLDVAHGGSYVVIGSRGDLEQAFLNLLINAERACAKPPGSIAVVLRAEAGEVVVRVEDDGNGFGVTPPDRAFQPFVSDGDPFEFAGLGLWAARVLLERHGGALTIEPLPKGTAVVMRVPAEPARR